MKIWYKFYQSDIIRWDLLIKTPSLLKFKSKKNVGGLTSIYPELHQLDLYMKLHINNDSDFKIIKALRFYNDLFKSLPLKLKIIKFASKSAYNKGDKFLKLNLKCNKYLSIYFLQILYKNIYKNILKKQLPYSFGIDQTGVVSISLRDIGEIGLRDMKYDYFGWSNNLIIKFSFGDLDIKHINLLVSYLNFKFKV